MQNCILPVCGGSAEMNGRLYIDFIKSFSKSFEKVHIVLADTLDAHNMTTGPRDWGLAMECSKSMGDRWLGKHYEDISYVFGGEISLIRWDEIKAHPTFFPKYELTKKIYLKSENVLNYVHSVCEKYVEIKAERQRQLGASPDVKRLRRNSVNYMLEEIAGSSVYWDLYACDVLYPGEYFCDRDFFNRNNLINRTINLTVPENVFSKNLENAAA